METRTSTETGSALKPNNFSSIARRLLLNGESRPVSQLPSTSYDRTGTHVGKLKPTDLFPCHLKAPKSKQQQLYERVNHSCNLCRRVRGLTKEMLKAPMEKPRDKKGRGGRPPSIGRKASVTISHVRQFFEQIKKQLDDCYQDTLFNSPTLLTALACGISRNSVSRFSTGLPLNQCKLKEPDGKNTLRVTTLKKYGQEWGEAVHHFVSTALEEEGNITVADLHNRLSSVYAGFPMCTTTLYGFLRGLGFSYKKDRNKIFILAEGQGETESESESEYEDEEENV
ncbi:hypothetical protein ANCCAN_13571 [Ancylostoma caninum]|uniref:Uncharacterized protein n=1 Tax=Ancylostoma caninum TaxID=29170 RepID=A0A368G7W8_ANCCA|nr:hypothetical protein ANCCAN_13571 [Ancylostoma caninum]